MQLNQQIEELQEKQPSSISENSRPTPISSRGTTQPQKPQLHHKSLASEGKIPIGAGSKVPSVPGTDSIPIRRSENRPFPIVSQSKNTDISSASNESSVKRSRSSFASPITTNEPHQSSKKTRIDTQNQQSITKTDEKVGSSASESGQSNASPSLATVMFSSNQQTDSPLSTVNFSAVPTTSFSDGPNTSVSVIPSSTGMITRSKHVSLTASSSWALGSNSPNTSSLSLSSTSPTSFPSAVAANTPTGLSSPTTLTSGTILTSCSPQNTNSQQNINEKPLEANREISGNTRKHQVSVTQSSPSEGSNCSLKEPLAIFCDRDGHVLFEMRTPVLNIGRRSHGSDEYNEDFFDLSTVPFIKIKPISRLHAVVTLDMANGSFLFKNHGRNGSRVDAREINAEQDSITLHDGSIIELGKVMIVFHINKNHNSQPIIIQQPKQQQHESSAIDSAAH